MKFKCLVRAVVCVAVIGLARAVTLTWDPNPPEEQVTSYQVYQATNVAGPFSRVAVVTNETWTAPLPPGHYFWYVTASNFWTEGPASQTVSTPNPAGKVAVPRVTR
jgi:hypothetical protein